MWISDKCLSSSKERKQLNHGGWPLRQHGLTRANHVSAGWNINRRAHIVNWGSGLCRPPCQDTLIEIETLLCEFSHGQVEPSLSSDSLRTGEATDDLFPRWKKKYIWKLGSRKITFTCWGDEDENCILYLHWYLCQSLLLCKPAIPNLPAFLTHFHFLILYGHKHLWISASSFPPRLSLPPLGADVAHLVNYCHFRLVSANRAHANMKKKRKTLNTHTHTHQGNTWPSKHAL